MHVNNVMERKLYQWQSTPFLLCPRPPFAFWEKKKLQVLGGKKDVGGNGGKQKKKQRQKGNKPNGRSVVGLGREQLVKVVGVSGLWQWWDPGGEK